MDNILNPKNSSIASGNSGATPVLNDKPKAYKVDLEAQKNYALDSMMGRPVFSGTEKEYNSLASYGAQPNLYQTQAELERTRAKNQSAWEQAFNSIGQAIGTVVGDTVGGFGMLADIATGGTIDDKAYSNPLTELGDSISNATREALPIYRENPDKAIDLEDFSGWFFSHLPSVASSLSLMIPGTAFAKGASLVGRGAMKGLRTSSKLSKAINKVEKFTKLDNVHNLTRAKVIAQNGLTAVGMRLGENYQEARATGEQVETEAIDTLSRMGDDNYNKWLEENPDLVEAAGSSDKADIAKVIASKAADTGFAYNSANVVFDFIQLMGINSAFKGMFSKPVSSSVKYTQRDALNKLASTGLSSTGEGLKKTIGTNIKEIANTIGRKANMSARFTLSQSTEGIEEAINFIGGEEGTAYGRYLLSEDKGNYDRISSDRISKYMANPHLYNSALWGVIGGVTFGGAMNAINNTITKRKGGITENQQRIAEINGREQIFNNYAKSLNTIRTGFNPFEVETDTSGKPIRYMEDGSISSDETLGLERNTKINTPEEQEELLNETRSRFATNIALNAIAAGNYELLEDYISSPQIRKKMIDSGLATEEDYDNDNKFVLDSLKSVLESYKRYSTVLKDANIEDAYLDIALQENVVNDQEIKFIDKRLARLRGRNQELVNNVPELQKYQTDNSTNLLKLSILEQARRQLYEGYNELKDSKNALDRVNASELKDRIDAIDSIVKNIEPTLSTAESLANRLARKLSDSAVGLENKDLVADEINEFIKSEDAKLLFGAATSALSGNKELNEIYAINPEYGDNLQAMLMDDIRKEAFANKIVTTRESVESKANSIKAHMEAAAKYKIQQAELDVIDAFDAADSELLVDLEAIVNGTIAQEAIDQNPILKDVANAILVLKMSSNDMASVTKLLEDQLAKAKSRVERSRVSTQEEETGLKPEDEYDAAIAAAESMKPATAVKPIEIKEVIENEETSEKLDNLVDALLADTEAILITDSTIGNYNLEVKKAFNSTSIKNGSPIKVKGIRIVVSKFGNVAIDGFITSSITNSPDADVTLEELNAAIASGDIVATLNDDVRESTIEEGINPEDNVSKSSEAIANRSESLKLVFELYADAVSTESIDGVPIISLESLMRHIQSRNPKAISLFDGLRSIAISMAKEGSIVLNDAPSVISQSRDEFAKTIVVSDRSKIERAAKEISKNNSFGMNIATIDFENMSPSDVAIYKAIMKLKANDKVMIRLEDGMLNSYSGKVRIGSLPVPNLDVNNNPTVINEFWKYTTVKSKSGYDIAFIDRLKVIVTSNKESDRDLIVAIYRLKAAKNTIRFNPKAESSISKILAELEENDTYRELVSIFSENLESKEDKYSRANHISKILMYDRNINPNMTNYGDTIAKSLTVWADKVGDSYSRATDIYKSISRSKRKSKSVRVASSTSGRLILNSDANGRPTFNNIDSVLTAESTDNYQLYGIDNGSIVIRDGSNREVGKVNTTKENGNTILFVKDSEGRKIRVNTKGNTANNSLTESNNYTDRFNDGLLELFDSLTGALLSKNTRLFGDIVENLNQYIGSGKTLYGYTINKMPDGNYVLAPRKNTTKGSASDNYKGMTVFFNISSDYPNIKFKYPDGTVSRAYGITAKTGDTIIDVSKASRKNVKEKMPDILNYLSRNIINEAANYNSASLSGMGNPTVRFVNGRFETKIPSLSNDTWFEESYDSYGEFAIKTGLLVTSVGAIKDGKGNILGNFAINDSSSNSIGFNKNIHLTTERKSSQSEVSITSPVEEASDPIATVISNGVTITELAKQFNIREYDAILESLEAAGLVIAPVVEEANRFANINLKTNTITLSNKWVGLDNTQRLLKIIHEGVHYYLKQEGVDIKQFKDLYDKFREILDTGRDSGSISEEAYKLYSKYLSNNKSEDIAIEEFIVEALTSREFANLLSSIPYESGKAESGTIFSKLVDAIVKIIGNITNIDNTLLGEINNRLSNIVTEKAKISETIETRSRDTIAEDIDIFNNDTTFDDESILDNIDSMLDSVGFDSDILDTDSRAVPTMQSLITRLNPRTRAFIQASESTGTLKYLCS